VTNQMDADTLNMCQTFNGTLNVLSTISTSTISVPALKNITGDLYIAGDGSLSNSTSMSYFSMQSLEFVGGTITVGPLFNLATLHELPLLADLNFVAGLKDITGYTRESPEAEIQVETSQISIQKTGLISLEGLTFRDIDQLTISDNALRNFTLSLESLNCEAGVAFQIYQNHNMSLNLPNMTTTNCSAVEINDLYDIEIPALRTVNGSLSFINLGQAAFTAPNLMSVSNTLSFEGGVVSQINLPALETANSLQVANLPAVYLADGILIPNVWNVSNVIITGTNDSQPYCQILDNQRCRGLFTANYQCGSHDVGVDLDPNNCQYTYTASGWTRAEKIKVGLGLTFGTLVLLGSIWLINHQIKLHRASSVAAHMSNNFEAASNEQLPKYSLHDDESGAIPPYETNGSIGAAAGSVTGGESETVVAVTKKEIRDDVHGEEESETQHEVTESVPVSPLSP